jgi:hypothetical protein
VAPFVKKNHCRFIPFLTTPSQAGIADDREQPGFTVPAAEAIEKTESAQIRFLHDILRILLISCQPERKIMSSVQMRNNGSFKKR